MLRKSSGTARRSSRSAPPLRRDCIERSVPSGRAVEPADRLEMRLRTHQIEQLAPDEPLVVAVERLAQHPLIAEQTQPAGVGQAGLDRRAQRFDHLGTPAPELGVLACGAGSSSFPTPVIRASRRLVRDARFVNFCASFA